MAGDDKYWEILVELRGDTAAIRRDLAHNSERIIALEGELRPVQQHVARVEGGAKLAAGFLGVLGVLGGYLKLFGGRP